MMLKNKVIILFFVLVLVSLSSNAFVLTTFNDSSSSGTLTYASAGVNYLYLNLPIGINVTTALMNVSGTSSSAGTTATLYPLIDGYIEYQNGSYSKVNTTSSNLWAGQWFSTSPDISYDYSSYLKFNLSSVTQATNFMHINTAQLFIRTVNCVLLNGGEGTRILHEIADIGSSVDSSDFSASTITDYGGFGSSCSQNSWTTDYITSIYGATSQKNISFEIEGSIKYAPFVDVDNITTLFNQTSSRASSNKPYLSIDYDYFSMSDVKVNFANDGITNFNHTGLLKTNNITSNSFADLNTYLSTCTPTNGNCTIPINITSGVAGSLGYLGLNITYTDLQAPTYSNIMTVGTNKTNTSIRFNTTWSDNILLSNWIFSQNITGTWKNESTYSFSNTISNISMVLNITRGKTFDWMFYANDSTNNWNQTTLQRFTVLNTIPLIPTLNYPANTQEFDVNWVTLNYSSTDIDSDTITYYVYADTTINPTTLLYNGTNQTFNYTSLADNTYYWKVHADDGYENSSNSSIYSFTISTTAPAITLNYPLDNAFINTNIYQFNFTPSDSGGVSYCKLYGNWSGTWQENETKPATTGVLTNFTAITFAEGQYKWNVWCNDTSNNGGFSAFNRTFTIDLNYPQLSVSNPVNGGTYYTETTGVIINTLDTYLDKCYMQLYYKDSMLLKNTTLANCSGTTTIDTPIYSQGYLLRVYANDTSGQINSTEINFTISSAPSGGTTAGGGGGGSTPKYSCNNSLFRLETNNAQNVIDFYLLPEGKKTTTILLFNDMLNTTSFKISCYSADNTCENVVLAQAEYNVSANVLTPSKVQFTYTSKDEDETKHFFSIIATDVHECSKKIDINVNIGYNIFSFFTKTINIPSSKLNSSWQDFQIPSMLFALLLIAILFLISQPFFVHFGYTVTGIFVNSIIAILILAGAIMI